MEMRSTQKIPQSIDLVWQALNDVAVLKSCIVGCESLELLDESRYAIIVTVAVGPVKARFSGKLSLTDLDPPHAYRITFEAQAPGAGFGKGVASVHLEDCGATTALTYEVSAQIGGKLAQIGSRLVDAAAKKVAAEFFACFEKELTSRNAPIELQRIESIAPIQKGSLFRYLRSAAILTVVVAVLVAVVWWLLR